MRSPETQKQAQSSLAGYAAYEGDFNFAQWLTAQATLQVAGGKPDPRTLVIERSDGSLLVTEEGAQFFAWNAAALVFELGEASDEIGWKPWATDRRLDRGKYIAELVDLMHFLANLLRLANVSGRELTMAYQAKMTKNLQRWQQGYDGVSDKCPNCHRELDEPSLQKYAAFQQGTGKLLTFCTERCAVEFDG